MNRNGRVLGTLGEPDGSMTTPRISPDGRRMAVTRARQDNLDLWLLDGDRRTARSSGCSPPATSRPESSIGSCTGPRGRSQRIQRSSAYFAALPLRRWRR